MFTYYPCHFHLHKFTVHCCFSMKFKNVFLFLSSSMENLRLHFQTLASSIRIYSILSLISFFFLVVKVHMNCACGKLPRLNACGGCRQHGMAMKIRWGMRVNTAKHWTHEAHNNGTVKHTHWRRYLEQKYRVQAHGLDAQYVFFLQTIQSSFFMFLIYAKRAIINRL